MLLLNIYMCLRSKGHLYLLLFLCWLSMDELRLKILLWYDVSVQLYFFSRCLLSASFTENYCVSKNDYFFIHLFASRFSDVWIYFSRSFIFALLVLLRYSLFFYFLQQGDFVFLVHVFLWCAVIWDKYCLSLIYWCSKFIFSKKCTSIFPILPIQHFERLTSRVVLAILSSFCELRERICKDCVNAQHFFDFYNSDPGNCSHTKKCS